MFLNFSGLCSASLNDVSTKNVRNESNQWSWPAIAWFQHVSPINLPLLLLSDTNHIMQLLQSGATFRVIINFNYSVEQVRPHDLNSLKSLSLTDNHADRPIKLDQSSAIGVSHQQRSPWCRLRADCFFLFAVPISRVLHFTFRQAINWAWQLIFQTSITRFEQCWAIPLLAGRSIQDQPSPFDCIAWRFVDWFPLLFSWKQELSLSFAESRCELF